MPRTARSIEAGMVDYVLNPGNGRLRLFHKEGDYDAFERVLVEGLKRYPVDLLTYCLMPSHWHRVVRPRTDVALGRLMRLRGPGRPGWLPTQVPHRSGLAHHAHPVPHLMNSRPARSVVVTWTWFRSRCTCQMSHPDYPSSSGLYRGNWAA